MKLRRKGWVAALAAGSVMLLSALLLFCVNRAEDEKAGAQAQRLLTALQTSVTNTDPRPTDVPADASSGGILARRRRKPRLFSGRPTDPQSRRFSGRSTDVSRHRSAGADSV